MLLAPMARPHASDAASPTAKTVFLIGSGWWPETKGGAEAIFHGSLAELRRAGFALRGVVPGSDAVARDSELHGFSVRGVSLPRRAMAIRAHYADCLAGTSPDLIASHFALYALPVLSRLKGRPFVAHFHGPWALESQVEGDSSIAVHAKAMLERLVYRRADRLIVLSEAFGHLVQAQYGVRDAALRVVPGAIDTRHFDIGETPAEARRQLGWPDDRPNLFAVRRLVRRMGIGSLIEAMALLRDGRGAARDAILHIAGTGPEREALVAQAAALGLQDAVRFMGFLPDAMLPLAYRAADLTIVPSTALEGFGLTAVESLASGTPVLVTPIGGLPEVVAPLSPTLVLEGCDPVSIAAGVAHAIKRRADLPDAEECRRYAVASFDWQVAGPRLADIYREVL